MHSFIHEYSTLFSTITSKRFIHKFLPHTFFTPVTPHALLFPTDRRASHITLRTCCESHTPALPTLRTQSESHTPASPTQRTHCLRHTPAPPTLRTHCKSHMPVPPTLRTHCESHTPAPPTTDSL